MELPLSLILMLLFGHFVGDFVLQTSKQALYKYQDSNLLWGHVWAWLFTLITTLVLYHLFTGYRYNPTHTMYWMMFMAGTHFITDFVTSRLNRMFKDQGNEKMFWNMIGFDQFIHVALLLYFSAILL